MKRLLTLWALLTSIAPFQGYGQLNKEFVPFLARDYTYQFVKSNSKFIGSFYTAGADPGTGWSTGPGAFGTLNNTSAPPCPLNEAVNVQTLWPSSRDLLLRRHITLPAGTHNLRIAVAIDNAVQLFFNGKDLFGGIKTHNDCATPGGDFELSVPDDSLLIGDNVIAVYGIWMSSKNYFDMRVTGDVYHTITVQAGEHGSITPSGPVTIYPGMDPLPTFSIAPDPGYRIDDVKVNGVSQGKISTWTCPDATKDYTIAATFSVIMYKLTISASSFGTVTVSPNQAEYLPGTVVTLTAYTSSGYHFAGWTGDLTGLTNPATVTMNSDKSVIPGFEANSPITVSITEFTEKAIRDAITETNNNPGPDRIEFVSGGTVELNGPLPILTDEVTLTVSNGGVVILQPSSNFTGDGTTHLFEISGLFLPWGYTPQHTTISDITVRNFPGAGIFAQSNGLIIQGCTIIFNGGDGIRIDGGSNNLIGGREAGQGNTIAYNEGNGIVVLEHEGFPMPSNTGMLNNSIYGNVKLGIDLGGNGVTQNNYPRGPSAPEDRPGTPAAINFGQNFPVLFSASIGSGSVAQGSLLKWRNTQFLIEVFASDTADPSGYGEGKLPVGSKVVTTNDTGYVWFEIPTTMPLSFGQFITATATDLTGGKNNTSEFSAAIPAGVNTKVFGTGYVVNTTMSGIPLHWPDGKATYMFSPSIKNIASGFVTAIDNSFATWSSVSGTRTDGVPWSLQYTYGGMTSSATFGGDPDGINNIVWITDDWFTTTGIDPNVIAVTRVRYNAINGEMTDVDIAMNARSDKNPNGFLFGVAPTPDSYYTDESYRDVQNVVTHEAGHFSGLGDIYNPGYAPYVPMMGAGNQDYTMYGIIRGNETIKRSLTQNDKDGIAYIYNEAPQGHIELMLVFDGSSNFVTQYGAFDAAKNSAAELVERMNVGDKVGIIQLPGDLKYPLHVITDAASRAAVVGVIQGLTQGGTSTIGAGLQTGLGQLSSSVGGIDAMILFSAGEESGVPTALSIVPGLNSDNAHLFTLGFAGSSGQDLCSKLADATGGAYFLASSATMSTVVKEIWNRLTTLQTIAYLAFYSNQQGFNWQGGFNYQGGFNWQGGFNYQGGFNWQGGFNYQGAVDEGTLKILPGFNWQGSGGELALVPPQDGYSPPTSWDTSQTFTVPYGVAVITPDNWDQIPVPNQFFTSIRYIEGPTYSFYEVIGPKPGKWTLIPCGDPSNSTQIELLTLSVIGLTDVSMDVMFSKSTYEPGTDIQAQVSLSQGGVALSGEYVSGGTKINDATVEAEIGIPGLTTPVTITLASQGNGLYTGTLGNGNTSQIGTYDFKFTAIGKVLVSGSAGPMLVNFKRLCQQSVYVAPPFAADGVLVADGSVTVGDGCAVSSGSVLVNSSIGKLSVGAGVTTPARYTLKANSITIGSGSIIASDVYYNKLSNSGTLGGSTITPYSFSFLTFPTMVTGTPGAVDIILSNGQTKILSETDAKAYRDVILAPQSTLILNTGGQYNFRSVWVKSGAQLLFTAKTVVTVSAGFRPDNGSYVGPKNGATITEADIVIYVASKNSQSTWSTSVNIGPQAHFYANVEAKNGTIWIQDNSDVAGAFVSKDVLVGKYVKAALNTSFSGLKKGSGDGWSLAPEQSAAALEIPTVYSLSQNYPNPFNPSTTIKYTIPGAGSQGPGASKISLVVYDVLGKEVATLVNELKEPGTYEVTWDASGQASGVYFYRMKAGSFVDTKKLVVLK